MITTKLGRMLTIAAALALPVSASAFTVETDTVGGTANSNNGDEAYKLNVFTPAVPVTLQLIEMYLEPDPGRLEIHFVVYRAAMGPADPWELIYDSGEVLVTEGLGFKAGPDMSVDLEVGEQYGVGIYFTPADMDYYWEDVGPEDLGWGLCDGNLFAANDTVEELPDVVFGEPGDNQYRMRVTVLAPDDLDGDGSYELDDCDDNDPDSYPGAPELCDDGIDQDCSGVPDDNLEYRTWYADNDGDGHGGTTTEAKTCDGPPSGYVDNNGDCDDDNAAVNPYADEVCNEIDDNCNDEIDEGFELFDWYADDDGDGYGAGSPVSTCDETAPAGFTDNADDCDDADDEINPGAEEQCNTIDDNCDGVLLPDEVDDDGDGALNCDDCVIDDAEIYPGADDPCNGVDNDCDGYIPEGKDCDPFIDEGLNATRECGCSASPAGSGAPLLALLVAGAVAARRRR